MYSIFKDYYRILGVSRDSSIEEIKKAYRRLVKKLHPDNHQSLKISEREIKLFDKRLKEVKEAYEVLKDATKRKAYDTEYIKFHADLDRQRAYYMGNRAKKNAATYVTKDNTEPKNDLHKRTTKEAKSDNESFYTRHKKVNAKYNKTFKSNKKSLQQELVFHIGKGTVHIGHEILYRINTIKNYAEPKFILNKKVIVATTVGAVLIATNFLNIKDKVAESDTVKSSITYAQDEYQSLFVTLNRNYTVRAGDTLTGISENSGTSINTLKRLNGIKQDSSIIQLHQQLKVPYRIATDDLEYYTTTTTTSGKTLSEIASEYETDIETLVKLNEGAISLVGDTYLAYTDEIIVPKYILKEELEVIKKESSDNKEHLKNNSL